MKAPVRLAHDDVEGCVPRAVGGDLASAMLLPPLVKLPTGLSQVISPLAG